MAKMNLGMRIHVKDKTVMKADKGDGFCWLVLEDKEDGQQPVLIFPPKGATYADLVPVAEAFNAMVAKANAAVAEMEAA